jgi:hypothetical protein
MEESTHEDLVKQLKELQNVIDDFVEDKCDRQVVFKELISAIKLVQKDMASTMDARATPCSGCRGATTTKTKEAEKGIYS